MHGDEPPPAAVDDPRAITRPHDSLLTYYFWVSAASLLLFPFVFVPLFIRFKTLRYRFDDKGVSMAWGLLFHKEVYLTYRRIQDIHVTRNLLERWMGLAKVPIQTASGTSGATMRIEGIRNPEPLRDFLYAHMRGAKGERALAPADRGGASDAGAGSPAGTSPGPESEAIELLREIRNALRELGREQRDRGGSGAGGG